MNRREVILGSTALAAFAHASAAQDGGRLQRPEGRRLRAAFLIGTWTNSIDLATPWEMFANVESPDMPVSPIEAYTVAARNEIVPTSGGLQLQPHYTIENAPDPDIVVVPAHRPTPETTAWLTEYGGRSDVTLAICMGAYQLADTGLLDGRAGVTHKMSLPGFDAAYPAISVPREKPFTVDGPIVTARGMYAAVDASLVIIGKYFGVDMARSVAMHMEHSDDAWMAAI